jgi:hypothetical protein
MCRHALKPHLLFNVARCACRHIGAQRSMTRSSPRCALAPGTAPLALRNARLTQNPPGCTTLPRSACVSACAGVAAMQRARPARPSQAQSPARAGTPHRRLWSTSGTGRSTSRAHADSARALSASAFGPTARHPSASVPRVRVCWPRSSSAALCRSPPQAPGHGTEPLPGQPPASNGTAHPCAGHCFARAQQCPANPDASLVHQPPRPASVRTHASSAVL